MNQQVTRFEVQPTLSADIDGDGIVDGTDLGILLGSWTSRSPSLPHSLSPTIEISIP